MTVTAPAPRVAAGDWVRLVQAVDQLDDTTVDDLADACGPRGWVSAVNQAAPHLLDETKTWLQTGEELIRQLRAARVTCGQLAGGDQIDYVGTQHLIERISQQLHRWREHAHTLVRVAYQHAT